MHFSAFQQCIKGGSCISIFKATAEDVQLQNHSTANRMAISGVNSFTSLDPQKY